MHTSPCFHRVDAPLVDALSRYVARNCPTSLWQQREDIVQQILVRIHRLSQRRDLQLSRAYLKRAAKHGVCDAWRRRAHEPVELASEPASPNGDLDTQTSQARALDAAARALATLPDARRQAVLLYLQGSRISEVADALGCDRKRADNLVYRGLAAVRRTMTAQGHGRDQLLM